MTSLNSRFMRDTAMFAILFGGHWKIWAAVSLLSTDFQNSPKNTVRYTQKLKIDCALKWMVKMGASCTTAAAAEQWRTLFYIFGAENVCAINCKSCSSFFDISDKSVGLDEKLERCSGSPRIAHAFSIRQIIMKDYFLYLFCSAVRAAGQYYENNKKKIFNLLKKFVVVCVRERNELTSRDHNVV